jgi:hypothetical protein
MKSLRYLLAIFIIATSVSLLLFLHLMFTLSQEGTTLLFLLKFITNMILITISCVAFIKILWYDELTLNNHL